MPRYRALKKETVDSLVKKMGYREKEPMGKWAAKHLNRLSVQFLVIMNTNLTRAKK